MNVLHLGSGPQLIDGWTNVDIVDHGQEHVLDVTGGLPFPDDWFDAVVSHHVLMMVPWPQILDVLVEARRVTKPLGVLRVSVPNLIGAFVAWMNHDTAWFPIDDRTEDTLDGKLCLYVTQAGATKSVFTPRYLNELLHRSGWREVEHVDEGVTVHSEQSICRADSRGGESVYVEALA